MPWDREPPPVRQHTRSLARAAHQPEDNPASQGEHHIEINARRKVVGSAPSGTAEGISRHAHFSMAATSSRPPMLSGSDGQSLTHSFHLLDAARDCMAMAAAPTEGQGRLRDLVALPTQHEAAMASVWQAPNNAPRGPLGSGPSDSSDHSKPPTGCRQSTQCPARGKPPAHRLELRARWLAARTELKAADAQTTLLQQAMPATQTAGLRWNSPAQLTTLPRQDHRYPQQQRPLLPRGITRGAPVQLHPIQASTQSSARGCQATIKAAGPSAKEWGCFVATVRLGSAQRA